MAVLKLTEVKVVPNHLVSSRTGSQTPVSLTPQPILNSYPASVFVIVFTSVSISLLLGTKTPKLFPPSPPFPGVSSSNRPFWPPMTPHQLSGDPRLPRLRALPFQDCNYIPVPNTHVSLLCSSPQKSLLQWLPCHSSFLYLLIPCR